MVFLQCLWQGFPACRVLVAGSVGVLRSGCSGMFMVQEHSGLMLWLVAQ